MRGPIATVPDVEVARRVVLGLLRCGLVFRGELVGIPLVVCPNEIAGVDVNTEPSSVADCG